MSTERDRPSPPAAGLDRRSFLGFFAGLGVVAGALPELLFAEVEKGKAITRETLADAETLSGLHFTDPQRELMLKGLAELREGYTHLREVALANDVPPAFHFDPRLPKGEREEPVRAAFALSSGPLPPLPAAEKLEELAYLPLADLARLVQARRVSSTALTRMYLARLRRLDPVLHAVITFTEEKALEQAERADREIAAGRYLGPLHGIPWAAKDLLAVRGYPTTWGSVPFKSQVLDADATVVRRLERAGAVLIAKTAVGELAWGDVWFGGMTRNPWKPEQGSSGSSAGSAAATAAGAVGFAIGTETLGSIVSPSTRTGTTGLRPTFGRVSRHGAMALAWTMDKVGVLARGVEDCAAVFHAIHGPDGLDDTVIDAPFAWDPRRDPRRLKVGYAKALFEAKPQEGREETHALDRQTLAALREQGFDLLPIDLPSDLPAQALSIILSAEAAAAFDELTRSGRDELLVRHLEENAWPNVFRQGRTIPAVEYIQANRVRTLAMREMKKLMSGVDVYVAPTFGGANLLLTNLTGHPAVVLPNGFKKDGTPASITFTGRLFGEADLLAVAKVYQDGTGFHRRHPTL
ncbi:MAG TPA: amidase [Thermoanaerobaculia bacterium]|nr:amidase [Thermoanaerobaculia bacterium]